MPSTFLQNIFGKYLENISLRSLTWNLFIDWQHWQLMVIMFLLQQKSFSEMVDSKKTSPIHFLSIQFVFCIVKYLKQGLGVQNEPATFVSKDRSRNTLQKCVKETQLIKTLKNSLQVFTKYIFGIDQTFLWKPTSYDTSPKI